MLSRNNENNENIAKKIASEDMGNDYKIYTNPSTIKVNGCVACHVLFSIVDKMHVNESEFGSSITDIVSPPTAQ